MFYYIISYCEHPLVGQLHVCSNTIFWYIPAYAYMIENKNQCCIRKLKTKQKINSTESVRSQLTKFAVISMLVVTFVICINCCRLLFSAS